MKPRSLNYTAVFKKELAKIPKDQLKKFARKEKIFRQNIFDPRLKTHKLGGKLFGFYSFSISYNWRIVFHLNNKDVIFDSIGTYNI